MSNAISNRITKLEERHAARHPTCRVFSTIVRQGHEAEDEAQALTTVGQHPGPDDMIVRRVIVPCPATEAMPADFIPRVTGPRG
ncbi:hypothetical protein [Aureimonas leprariae]|uniref:Uncharacterized protein n=1 Tax=Plantimonas leprariae TaxID=2615207 RepID=A0A7V7TWY4_9HYPH|nr:hypothetical protein [Aureimonas leprariae]KAB0680080.1 hypothetical protein F6X38_09730 [Aureimonas leprariae]